MRLYLTDQRHYLHNHLEQLKQLPVLEFKEAELPEKTFTVDLGAIDPLDRMDLGWLFDYRIYPEHILTHLPQWRVEGREMREGDTIAIQIHLPPTPRFSLKTVFGVRITEVLDGADRKGFSYATLDGHPEKGVSTFTVEMENGTALFKVHVRSVMANPLTKWFAAFTFPYRDWCIRQALQRIRTEHMRGRPRPPSHCATGR